MKQHMTPAFQAASGFFESNREVPNSKPRLPGKEIWKKPDP